MQYKKPLLFIVLLWAVGSVSLAKPLDLAVSLTTDKTIYRTGQTVLLTLEATNKSSAAADLLFGSGQSYDIFITDLHKQEVWRWSQGRVFTMAVREVLLPAGRSLKFTSNWKPARPGKYFVRGRLTIAAPLDSPPKTIIIRP